MAGDESREVGLAGDGSERVSRYAGMGFNKEVYKESWGFYKGQNSSFVPRLCVPGSFEARSMAQAVR